MNILEHYFCGRMIEWFQGPLSAVNILERLFVTDGLALEFQGPLSAVNILELSKISSSGIFGFQGPLSAVNILEPHTSS